MLMAAISLVSLLHVSVKIRIKHHLLLELAVMIEIHKQLMT